MNQAKSSFFGIGCLTLMLVGAGCREHGHASGSAPAMSAQPPIKAAAVPMPFASGDQVVIINSSHDTLGAARKGLEAALQLPVDLPLPYPLVERHSDRFRVVLGRGAFSTLRPLAEALIAAGQAISVQAAGQAGGDDVIRLGIVCTDGESVSLYENVQPLREPLRQIARLQHGQVVVLKEDEDVPRLGPHQEEDSAEIGSEVAEHGFLSVLQPQAGLIRGPDVLLPADCTPRDEDNDDGNGRILYAGATGGIGRLCLTTRFAGRVSHLLHADVLAVAPNYRHCLHFPGSGTFDGFDQSRNGNHFAVEAQGGLRLYAVGEHGALQLRGQWPELSRPAFLGDHLVAVSEQPSSLGVVILDGVNNREVKDTTPLVTPRRIVSLQVAQVAPLPEKLPVHRPAAPTLNGDRIHVSFLRACHADWAKRVRAAAKKSYIECVLEIEVEVGLDGQHLSRHCKLDNVENPLEEPLTTPCP